MGHWSVVNALLPTLPCLVAKLVLTCNLGVLECFPRVSAYKVLPRGIWPNLDRFIQIWNPSGTWMQRAEQPWISTRATQHPMWGEPCKEIEIEELMAKAFCQVKAWDCCVSILGLRFKTVKSEKPWVGWFLPNERRLSVKSISHSMEIIQSIGTCSAKPPGSQSCRCSAPAFLKQPWRWGANPRCQILL